MAEVRRRLERALDDAQRLRKVGVAGQPGGDDRVVVGPDGAVVVREGVVGGVLLGHRADAPTGPHCLAHQGVHDGVDALGGHDPAPEQVPHVGAHRVDLTLVAVEGEDVVATARLGPVRRVEPIAQVLGLALEPFGQLPVAPDLPRYLGDSPLGVVDVALHLARRDRCGREPAVGEALRIVRVLPRLVVEAALGALLVLDEAVAVAIAVVVDPGQRRQRRRTKAAHEGGVVGPAPHLREQDEVERRRVDRAVVALEPRLRRLALADLVHDLARLRVDGRIVLRRLELGEHLERRPGELGAEQERL